MTLAVALIELTIQGRCVVCGGQGVSDAYYCRECTLQEKDVRSIFLLYSIRTLLSYFLSVFVNLNSLFYKYNNREMVARK